MVSFARAFAAGVLVSAMVAFSGSVMAARCAEDVGKSEVSGSYTCLAMTRFGPASLPAGGTLVVWLHGDVSSGGPANYHVALAERTARDDASGRTVAIALVRPGYPAGEGRASSGDANGRNDHYTAANVAEVAAALERLKLSTGASRLVVVGHSGGAATAAIAAGMRPGLIDGMVLVACPCDIVAWRSGRRAWVRSENPIAWAGKVAPATRVVALTGALDDNTPPGLANAYVSALQARGIDARAETIPDETHNGAVRSGAVARAVLELASPAPKS